MRSLLFGLTFCLVALSTATYADSGAEAILGTWLTNDSSAKVEIVQEQGVYNGRVVWLKTPLFPDKDTQGMPGKPKVDRLNPDKALQTRPIMGLALLAGFHYVDNNVWDDGTLYSPATGKSYQCKLTLATDGSLKITVGSSVFSKTVTWTRASPVPAAPDRALQDS